MVKETCRRKGLLWVDGFRGLRVLYHDLGEAWQQAPGTVAGIAGSLCLKHKQEAENSLIMV